MATNTGIEWTDATWNPTRGCSRVSEGCRYCYAERDAARKNENPKLPGYKGFARFVRIGDRPVPQWTGKVELIEAKLGEPLHWKQPRRVFVNSMSDLFHEELQDRDIQRVFNTMHNADWHTYQILTKRAERMRDLLTRVPWWGAWPQWKHAWLGVSVEDRKNKDRIDVLRDTPALVRFLSIEPLLEDLGVLDLRGISWVIVGGESGPGARPFDIQWAHDMVAQCEAAGVACFVKQLGARPGYQRTDGWHDVMLVDRKGGDILNWPADLRVREFPQPDRAEAGR